MLDDIEELNSMSETEERLRILNLLIKRPGWTTILSQALEVERERDEEYEVKGLGEFFGFQYFHVNTYNQVLLNMVARSLLYIAKDTGSAKFFRVKNPERIAEALRLVDELSEEEGRPNPIEESPSNF